MARHDLSGLRGFVTDAPEFGALRDGALVIDDGKFVEVGETVPRLRTAEAFYSLARMSAEDVLTLCVDRGEPETTRETYVRARCVYRKPEAEARG